MSVIIIIVAVGVVIIIIIVTIDYCGGGDYHYRCGGGDEKPRSIANGKRAAADGQRGE